jgi:hypothetical protein
MEMSINIYRRNFTAICPNNGMAIDYALEIQHADVIMVEQIVDFTAGREPSYHEAIADEAFELFGGVQILKAHHHGVDIETVRGSR